MYAKFIQAIKFNTIALSLYKTLLLCHQIMLFSVVSKELYGIVGTLFATIYLIMGLTNFGFEYTLFPFFSHFTQNRQHFNAIIKQYALRLYTIIVIATGLFVVVMTYSHYQFIVHITSHASTTLLILLCIIFTTESFKKSLEVLAQLAFLNQHIMYAQLTSIVTYVTLVWAWYGLFGKMTLYTIFTPMVVSSLLEIMILCVLLHKYYQQLPQQSDNNKIKSPQTKLIVTQQMYNYFNQVAKNIFSPNFIMVFLAYQLGMHQAGYIRYFTNIITLVYMMLNRAIGIPSGALLANLSKVAQDTVQAIFLKITNAYIQLLYVIACCIVTITTLLTLSSHHDCTSPLSTHIIFFVALSFVEYITMTYEKLYIAHGQARALASINISSVGIMLVSLWTMTQENSHFLLLPIFIVRIFTIITIAIIAYKKWKVTPRLSIKLHTLVLGIIFSAIIIFVHKKCF